MTTEVIVKETQRSYSGIAEMIADRAERGRDLYLTKRQLIRHIGDDEYLVPGSTGQRYTVHYGGDSGAEDCDCTDYQVHRGELGIPCKHLAAVALMFATRRRRIRQCETCGVPATEKTLVGLRGDRRRHGERYCLPHHPSSMNATALAGVVL